jgi:hypothetical protein
MMAVRRRLNWNKAIWDCECDACGGYLKKISRVSIVSCDHHRELNLPKYMSLFQCLRNFHQRRAFEQVELILQAALDPTIASSTRGELSRALPISTSYKQRYIECHG